MWYKTLGFHKYPLDPRSNTNLVGVDAIEKKLRNYVAQGNMCLLCGYTGSGKTSMLQRIMRDAELKQFTFVYISADGVRRDFLVEDAIRANIPLMMKILRRKPRNLIILLDESHLANRLLTESIKSQWNVQYEDGTKAIQSVIVSQIENRLGTNFSGSFADRLGKRILQMPKLSTDDLITVIRTRLDNGKRNYVDAFTDDALALLTKSADGSVRQLLEYTDAIFAHHDATESGNPLLADDYTISKEAVFNILQTTGLVSHDRLNKSKDFQKLLQQPKVAQSVDMFMQFGALSSVDLAEKLDVKHDAATKLIDKLVDKDAIVEAHEDDGRAYYVLSPRLQHEMTRA